MINNPWSKSQNDTSTYSKRKDHNDKDECIDGEWGDQNNASHSLRIGFLNIQTFPQLPGHHKNSNIRNLIHDYHLSVLGLAEMNLYWPSLPYDQQLAERTRQWFEQVKTFTSCNTCNTKMRGQRGGTATILRGSIVNTNYGCSADHLGRWTIMTHRGRGGHNLHIITAYRPQRNSNPYGVYQQQLLYNIEHSLHSNPITTFDQDLKKLVHNYVLQGDQVILLIDANEDLSKASSNSFVQQMQRVGLEEVILSRHSKSVPPPTRTPGSKPIDTIFCTSALVVNKSGYAPFNGFSDHRLSWVDIQWESAFNHHTKIQRAPARRLKYMLPVAVDKYTQVLEYLLMKNNIYSHIQTLNQLTTDQITEPIARMYEKIDKKITKYMLQAERKCRKLRMGYIPYSPQLAQLLNTINFWRLVIRKVKGHNISMRTIIRLQARCEISGKPLSHTESYCKERWKESITKYRQFKLQADKVRGKWLDEVIEQHILYGDTAAAGIIQTIKHREAQRSMHRRINSSVGQQRSKGVSRTIVPATTIHDEREYDQQSDIERENLTYMASLFQSANDTPLRTAPLVQEFGYIGDTVAGDEVTAGIYNPPTAVDEHTKLFLHCCSRPPQVLCDDKVIQMSPQEYADRWSTCREKTSSSPSGRHFGHYKCLHKMSLRTKTIFSVMFNIPARTGYSPIRWQRAIDVLLLKDQDDHRVHRTRPIPLLEADSNDAYKLLASQSNALATKHNLHAPEQYGGKDNTAAIHCASVKRGICDISRQTKTPLAICSIDARSCYDRIVHVAAFLSLRRLGVPKPMIHSMLLSIQQMQHQIRTSFGDSASSYGGATWTIPPHGTIQGNGASPMLWSAISAVLFSCLRRKCRGATFQSPITKETQKTLGFAFVDDTDLITTSPNSDNDATQMTLSMQQSLHTWQKCLQTTGGALDHSDKRKCYWYCIDYQWNKYGRWNYMSDTSEYQLHMEDENSQLREVYQCKLNESRKTLGIHLAPDGSMTSQLQFMKTKAQQFSVKLYHSNLSGYDAIFAANSRILKTLAYPLPVLTLSKQECASIMYPVISSVLAKAHVVRTIPRDILYGPKKYQGFGLTNLHVYQGCTQIAQLIQFSSTRTELSNIHDISLQNMIMELGVTKVPFQLSYEIHEKCATPCLMKHIWKFCKEYNVFLHNHIATYSPLREKDINLMEEFASNGIHGSHLAQLNRCRMYLQVIWLSDIVEADGKCIRKESYQGKQWSVYSHSYNWPTQPRPGATDWVRWREAIKKCFSPAQPTLLLPSPLILKDWLPTTTQSHFQWYFDHSTNTVYRRVTNSQMIKYVHTVLHQKNVYVQCRRTSVNISSLQICTVHQYKQNTDHVIIDSITDQPEQHSSSNESFLAYLKTSLIGEEWLLENITFHGDLQDIIYALGCGSLRGVSDGSCDFSSGLGTAGWCIIGCNAAIKGVNKTPSSHTQMDSTRTELSGIYTMVIIIEALSKYYNVRAGLVTMGSDSDPALDETLMSNNNTPLNKVNGKHIDFINAINRILRTSCIQYKGERIKGHQDDHINAAKLTWWEQRNVEMNDLAKSYMQHLRDNKVNCKFRSHLKTEGWSVTINGHKVTSHIITTTHDLICANNIIHYWHTHHRIKQDHHSHMINWTNMHKTMQLLPFSRTIWLIKHVSGYCATGYQMKKWKKWSTSQCPMCEVEENHHHIVRCQSAAAQTTWQELMNSFVIKLAKLKTPHTTIQHIVLGVTSCRWDIVVPITATEPTLQQALEKQTQVGWALFLDGLLVHEWEQHVKTFLNPLQNPTTWIRQLIKQLWNISWGMWEHRCSVVHAKNTTQRTTNGDIDEALQSIYNTPRNGMHPHEEVLFRPSLLHLLNQTDRYKRVWVQRAQNILNHSRSRYNSASQYSRERRAMKEWLGHLPPPTMVTTTPLRYHQRTTTHKQSSLHDYYSANTNAT